MFETVAAVYLFFWAVTWTFKNWFNLFVKISFFGMAIWAGANALQYWGYMIKIPQ